MISVPAFLGNYLRFTNNMRNIGHRTQTSDWQSFVLEKPFAEGSTFHRDSVIKGNVGDDVLYKAFMSVYWIAKQEIPKCKPVPLLQLLGKADVTEMKHFTHKSAGCVREHFLTLGQVIIEQLLEKVHRSIFVWSFVR